MADIEHQITISRPITEVYKAVTAYEDTEALQNWQTDLKLKFLKCFLLIGSQIDGDRNGHRWLMLKVLI